jgi:hypothetical protein
MDSRDVHATLDAWRASGAAAVDPVRFRFIEALARRTAAHEGRARRLLDEKLAQAIAGYGEKLERARQAPPRAVAAAPARDSGLAGLVALLSQHAPQAEGAHAATGPELKSVQLFRSTWARLSVHRWLAQAQAAVPDNAGPLNSQQLLHRTLRLMHEASPGYLDRFVSHVEALLWLEQAHAAPRTAHPGRRTARTLPLDPPPQ